MPCSDQMDFSIQVGNLSSDHVSCVNRRCAVIEQVIRPWTWVPPINAKRINLNDCIIFSGVQHLKYATVPPSTAFSVWVCYAAAPFNSNQFKIKNEISAVHWPQFSQCYQNVSYIISTVICNQSLSSKNNIFIYSSLLSVSAHLLVHLSVVSLFCLFDSQSVTAYFSFPFASSSLLSLKDATGSIRANGKPIKHSCTLNTQSLSWHHCLPFHGITKFLSK